MTGYTITIGSLLNVLLQTEDHNVRLFLLNQIDKMFEKMPSPIITADNKTESLSKFPDDSVKKLIEQIFIPCTFSNIITGKNL